jgi:hypothetical protein
VASGTSCGACGVVCDVAREERCADYPPAGYSCIPLLTAPQCDEDVRLPSGACPPICAAHQVHNADRTQCVCTPGFLDCDGSQTLGCESASNTDANCGSCGNQCDVLREEHCRTNQAGVAVCTSVKSMPTPPLKPPPEPEPEPAAPPASAVEPAPATPPTVDPSPAAPPASAATPANPDTPSVTATACSGPNAIGSAPDGTCVCAATHLDCSAAAGCETAIGDSHCGSCDAACDVAAGRYCLRATSGVYACELSPTAKPICGPGKAPRPMDPDGCIEGKEDPKQ